MQSFEVQIVSGPNNGQRIRVTQIPMIFGRTSSADVVIDWDGLVSSRHFRMRIVDGVPRIEDLTSTNGTFVNGKRINFAELRHQDQIVAGRTKFLVHLTDQSLFAATVANTDEDRFANYQKLAQQGTANQTLAGTVDDQALHQARMRRSLPKALVLIQVRLRVVSERGRGQVFWLGPDQTMIFGRTSKADCYFPDDDELSDIHFRVICFDDRCEVEDLQSSTGTWLNGRRANRSSLQPGDNLLAGATEFVVEIDGIEPSAQSKPHVEDQATE